ncbi:family 20 glycosylhydrolase [Nocardia terpenica]|uniref:beta-N-acetylhexosaminidase n=1 Tax=Nocardia terpenica TaxID=455432 RepID=A0A291RIU3_9NOCA|nr:family 20 glycosylhydrolase [Nocardia terpenica]ATL67209.1 beta-N-acetylhexosaminidase [Nocardia terpenica]
MKIVRELGEVPRRPDVIGIAPSGDVDECYRIAVDGDTVTCRARTNAGVARAEAAVRLLAAEGELRDGVVDEGPRYAWRGLMVDCARRFWSVEELRRIVDLCALYRLNVLHLHLTDDQGWRIEIPGWPRLTEAGAEYYSAAEFLDLQAYAATRFVTVVPEIDLPGHCGSAVRACPELRTLAAPTGLPESVPFAAPLDPYDPVTRSFITDVFDGLAKLTTGPYLHIGADEALGMDAAAFSEAVRLARRTVRAAGKRPIGWQESSRAGIEAEDIVQWWVDLAMLQIPDTAAEFERLWDDPPPGFSFEIVRQLAHLYAPTDHDVARTIAGGGRILLSPMSHLYLDRPYPAAIVPPDHRPRGLSIYPPRTVAEIAAWDPSCYDLPPDRIVGVEAALWSETLTDFDDLTTMLLPRLAAIADTAWTGTPAPWPRLRDRLAGHAALWRSLGLAAMLTTEVDWR